MSKLEEILYRRLESIREELDSYIAGKITTKAIFTAPTMAAPKKFAGRILPLSKPNEIDEDYVPSKKTAISFCLALQLEVEEAKKLLESAGYALSDSSRFDIIIMYLIENREYNVHFANIVLNDYGEGTLSK